MEKTHLTWSIERGGKCPTCNGATRLVIAPRHWRDADEDEEHELYDEVSGHFCPSCHTLVSLSLNTEV
jgi:Zn ribbon nucleic-acid-binding protein